MLIVAVAVALVVVVVAVVVVARMSRWVLAPSLCTVPVHRALFMFCLVGIYMEVNGAFMFFASTRSLGAPGPHRVPWALPEEYIAIDNLIKCTLHAALDI